MIKKKQQFYIQKYHCHHLYLLTTIIENKKKNV